MRKKKVECKTRSISSTLPFFLSTFSPYSSRWKTYSLPSEDGNDVNHLARALELLLDARSPSLPLSAPTRTQSVRGNGCNTPTTQRTPGGREGINDEHYWFAICDLAYPQDGLQARLGGLSTVLRVDPEENRPLVASSVTETTWSSKIRKANRGKPLWQRTLELPGTA